MKLYIDADFRCHVFNDGAMKEIETDAFDGKCDSFIEGYRFVPFGETWTCADGVVFSGEMIAPWKDLAALETAQRQYEALMEELDAAYREGVNSV